LPATHFEDPMAHVIASEKADSKPSESYKKTIQHLLHECGSLKQGERLLILCDPTTKDFALLFEKEAKLISVETALVEIPVASAHGQDPPAEAAEMMLGADLIMSLCQFSLAHTTARIAAGKRKARFLSMPCYTWTLLDDPALTVSYKKLAPVVRNIADLFTAGSKVRVQSKNGTDISLQIVDRVGNYCPGFVEKAGDLGSPPDIEANVSPEESKSQGTVVIDGSITCPELGLLTDAVTLTVKDGFIVDFASDNKEYVSILDKMFGAPDSKRRVLAECGIGLNPQAKLTGSMLTDEGAMGCMHFGFGSNYTVGGQNKVDFHLDFVFKNATMTIDDKLVIEDGDLKL
jgi:leucyl aminopeptidase (aminopeptidase T)